MEAYCLKFWLKCMLSTFIPVQNLYKQLEGKYPGVKFDVHTEEPISIVDSRVVLKIPEKTPDWEIVPSKLPAAVRVRYILQYYFCN